MNLFEKLKLLAEYAPLLTYMQQFAAEKDIHAKAVIIIDAAEWICSRNDIEWDDELVDHLSDILVSEEGEAFVRWILARLEVADE
jgi:hypothetical protein